jgi:hypothetical protein
LRSVWQQIGGYNEAIDSGEDTSFDLEVERRFPYAAAPRAQVAWQPRRSLKKAAWQQIFYGAGDGQARIQLAYHAAIAAFVAAEAAMISATAPAVRAAGALAVLCAVVYFAIKHLRLFGRIFPDIAYVALLMLVLPGARLFGFAVGLFGGSVRGILNRS